MTGSDGLFIGGSWRPGSERIVVEDPATEEPIAEVGAGTSDDALAACEAAAAAQPAWARTSPRERAEVLRRVWALLVGATDELAELIVAEHGKPLADARGEVVYAAEFFRWNAEEAVRLRGVLADAPAGGSRILVRHPPVGVVAVVTPWNFPAAMLARKLAPALAAGNAVVVKPAAETPLTALRVAELLAEAGVPDGVVNVVPTLHPAEWFDAVVDHPAMRMVSFTGSTEVGRRLLRRAADRVLRSVMELGGNAPFLVFADADLDNAVAGAMTAKMRHSAETCTAANRFLVEAPVAAEFAERLAEAMAGVRLGPGLEPGVTCGPLIHGRAVASVTRMVDEAVDAGARVLVGGSARPGRGHFFEPTVLADVTPRSPLSSHEIFGPVAPITACPDAEAMIRAANDTELGLAAYVYTGDLAKGLAVSERLQAGMVGLNRGMVSDPAAPFGGMKQSGLGREGSTDGIHEFCETQYIATDW